MNLKFKLNDNEKFQPIDDDIVIHVHSLEDKLTRFLKFKNASEL